MGSTTYYNTFLGTSDQPENQGNTNLQVIYFPRPILTSQLNFSDISYIASPNPGERVANWNDGHNVLLEMELFGCDQYDLTKGEEPFFLSFFLFFSSVILSTMFLSSCILTLHTFI
jgi:hypothetical protein